MEEKTEILDHEGDAYFERNFENKIKMGNASFGMQLFDEFLCNNPRFTKNFTKVLEIGCSYGFNLDYLKTKHENVECYGVEPSTKAVECGKKLFDNKLHLEKGTADVLNYSDAFFDVVMMGFCLYWTDRKYFMKILSESDRVLKTGGLFVIWDFDVTIPCRRQNKHNANTPTFKINQTNLFSNNPEYFLVEKRAFSDSGRNDFDVDPQNRCSLSIFYKDSKNAFVNI